VKRFQGSADDTTRAALVMTPYQKEQLDALALVREHFDTLSHNEKQRLKQYVAEYLQFRHRVNDFLSRHVSAICTQSCFQNDRSACCSRDGIITFFADVVINALNASAEELAALRKVLAKPHIGAKCVFLGPTGCLWRVPPIVCALFLCDTAQQQAFASHPTAKAEWQALCEAARKFKWPDRPVLFDALEQYFMDAGYTSPLMYLHNSPGLLRVKQKAGLKD
jgi:hypothetical protein